MKKGFPKKTASAKGMTSLIYIYIYIYIYGKTVSIAANEVTALLTDLGLPPF